VRFAQQQQQMGLELGGTASTRLGSHLHHDARRNTVRTGRVASMGSKSRSGPPGSSTRCWLI
jgi:hypothetical protein